MRATIGHKTMRTMLIVIGSMLLSIASCGNIEGTSSHDFWLPQEAFDIQQTTQENFSSLEYHHRLNPSVAVTNTRKNMIVDGFSGCEEQAEFSWHTYSTVRAGIHLSGTRHIEFLFRASPPSIATIESINNKEAKSMLVQRRDLPDEKYVREERQRLCGNR